MNPLRLLVLLVSLPLLLGAVCNAELRTWTAVNGKEVEAEFVSNEKGTVKLKLKSGKVFEVPLNNLSKSDQEFLKAKSSSGSLADTIVGRLITFKSDDGYTMQILLNEDGVMVVAGLRDQRLTYKIEGNEVLIFKEEERDGGISFSSSSPKVGDQVEMGAKEEKMRGKITKIEAADEFIRFSAKPEGVNGEEELEEREDIAYLKGSDTPYTGKVFELDGNGNKQREGFYKDGRREGIMIVWYYNGQKMREGNFKDGELDGLFIRWHMNGEKRAEGSFKDGKLVEGSEKFWNSKGEPVDSKEEARK
jgi:antitoxin component YwqK of YwqJK toxin-antitoxin module